MSCNSCHSDCSDIEIPVGPDGAQGDAGTDGVSVIADIIVGQDTVSSGAYETLYTYTLTNPSPLDEAGDQLVIRAYWSTATVGVLRNTRVQFGGNTLTAIVQIGSGIYYTDVTYTLGRVTSTTASLSYLAMYSSSLGVPINPGASYYHIPNKTSAIYQTTPNLDSGAHAITFQAYSNTIGDITLDRITIMKLEKV